MNYRIEAITLPIADIDRAKAFYEQAGWHLDVDTERAVPVPKGRLHALVCVVMRPP